MFKWLRRFVGPQQRVRYWSSSSFAKFLQKRYADMDKPSAAPMEEWRSWDDRLKERSPFIFWFTEEFLDDVQKVLYFPYDFLCSIRYYLYNRFVTKTHALTSSLERGTFHEFEERILHCTFDELVRFVEVEKAWMQMVWAEPEIKPWFLKFYPFRLFLYARPELGIKHLMWEIELREEYWDEDKKEMIQTDEPTRQAKAAQATLDLYKWWKFDRPQRIDPYVASGYEDFRLMLEENGYGGFMDTPKEYNDQQRELFKKVGEIEQQYNDEDDRMLIKLIEIRRQLWT